MSFYWLHLDVAVWSFSIHDWQLTVSKKEEIDLFDFHHFCKLKGTSGVRDEYWNYHKFLTIGTGQSILTNATPGNAEHDVDSNHSLIIGSLMDNWSMEEGNRKIKHV